MMHETAFHLVTAVAYVVIGMPLVLIALRVWWTHPINRAIRYGPYITPAGLRVLLNNWPFVFLFGVFILACALDHGAEWLFNNGYGGTWLVIDHLNMLAGIEAAVSVLTALSVLWAGVKLCLAR